MFKTLTNLFSPNNATKVVDGIYNGLDKAFYTDEEKAEDKIKIETFKVEAKMKLLPLYEPFKIAQRVIAITFTINFILAFWIGVGLLCFSNDQLLKSYLDLISVFSLGWIMSAIVAWYFTGGVINSFKEKK
jgi:hypothetical protein